MKLCAVAIVALSACSGCEDPWPRGTKIHTEVIDSARASVWHGQVDLAVHQWQVYLGSDCAFPYTLLDAPTDGSHAIRLVPEGMWYGPDDSTGAWYDDGEIIVMDKPNANYIIDTAMHELGHAMSGGWHSEHEGELMFWNGNGRVTDNDVRRMRDALGCVEIAKAPK